MNKLDIFRKRMSKLGIDMTFVGNYPWLYLDTINSKRVDETFMGEHGFTIMFSNINEFTDISEIFKLIRKYK